MRKISKNADNYPALVRANTVLQVTPDRNLFNDQFFGLTEPGDTLEARVTPSNRQVVKINKSGKKASFTRYPTTGTIVVTGVVR